MNQDEGTAAAESCTALGVGLLVDCIHRNSYVRVVVVNLGVFMLNN